MREYIPKLERWANEIILEPEFGTIDGIVADVDGSFARTEPLNLLAWKDLGSMLSTRETPSAQQGRKEKVEALNRFFELVFKKHGMALLAGGLLYLLTRMKFLPKEVYEVWNPSVEGYEQWMQSYCFELSRFPLPIWEEKPNFSNAQIRDLVQMSKDPEANKIRVEALRLLEDFMAGPRVSAMLAHIRSSPKSYIMPGSVEFFRAALAMGKKVSFFTAGHERVQIPVLEAIFTAKVFDELFEFGHRLYGNQTNHKPNPLGFHKMAAAMELPANRCLIVEDRVNYMATALSVCTTRKFPGCENVTDAFLGGLFVAGFDATEERVNAFRDDLGDNIANVRIIPTLLWARWAEKSRGISRISKSPRAPRA